MKTLEKEIPYGHARMKCSSCGDTYFVRLKVLKDKTAANNGCYPCDKCGSRDTTWEFRKIEKEGVSK